MASSILSSKIAMSGGQPFAAALVRASMISCFGKILTAEEFESEMRSAVAAVTVKETTNPKLADQNHRSKVSSVPPAEAQQHKHILQFHPPATRSCTRTCTVIMPMLIVAGEPRSAIRLCEQLCDQSA